MDTLAALAGVIVGPLLTNILRRSPMLEDYGATINAGLCILLALAWCRLVSSSPCGIEEAITRGLAIAAVGSGAYPMLPRAVQGVGMSEGQRMRKMDER